MSATRRNRAGTKLWPSDECCDRRHPPQRRYAIVQSPESTGGRMGMPTDIGVIDTMIGMPSGDRRWWARSMAPLLLDADSQGAFQHAASYMYKDLPRRGRHGRGPRRRAAARDGRERRRAGAAAGDARRSGERAGVCSSIPTGCSAASSSTRCGAWKPCGHWKVRCSELGVVAAASSLAAACLRCRSTTGWSTRSMRSASNSTSRSSSMQACPARECRWTPRMSRSSTRSAGSSRSCASCCAMAVSRGSTSPSS